MKPMDWEISTWWDFDWLVNMTTVLSPLVQTILVLGGAVAKVHEGGFQLAKSDLPRRRSSKATQCALGLRLHTIEYAEWYTC